MFSKIENAREEGRFIGFTASTFDVLHAGHVAMLAEAKRNCDFLVVGLLTDPTNDRPDTKNKPVQTTFERWIQADAIKYIDLLIPFDTEQDLEDMIMLVNPDVRFVGEEYRFQDFTGKEMDVNIHYNERRHSFSTTELRQRVCEAQPTSKVTR